MLKQRIITAIVLLAILLPALFYPSYEPFSGVILMAVAAGAWEWGRLNACGPSASMGLGALVFVAGAGFWMTGGLTKAMPMLWIFTGAAWVLGGALLLRVSVPGWPRVPRALRLASGVLALMLAWVAAVQARIIGINFLLSVLVLVWVSDTGAYAAGRAFGLKFTRNKLAPAISPGKSWEGVWGGMLSAVVLAGLWIWIDRAAHLRVASIYTHLLAQGVGLLVLGVLFLTTMSVVGDLVESLVKRSAGAKDSSALLPGHGGVLDRLDALLPTLPLAMMLVSL